MYHVRYLFLLRNCAALDCLEIFLFLLYFVTYWGYFWQLLLITIVNTYFVASEVTGDFGQFEFKNEVNFFSLGQGFSVSEVQLFLIFVCSFKTLTTKASINTMKLCYLFFFCILKVSQRNLNLFKKITYICQTVYTERK